MLDFLILAALSVLFAAFYPLHYLVVAATGLLVGLFFGGADFIFKLLFVLAATALLPVGYAHYAPGVSVNLIYVGITSLALTAGYAAGSLLSVALFPVKLAARVLDAIVNTVKGIFGR